MPMRFLCRRSLRSASLKAESCGQCHREIYEEWKTSIHAHAFEDPFFQAYWKKDKHIWVCLNCHTPLENQQPTLIKDIPRGRVEKAAQEPNPHFDAALQKESITCAACHVRDGVILGPFDDSAAPHPTKFDPSFRTAQFCSRCHNVVLGPAQFYMWVPVEPMLNMKASTSCRSGALFAKVVICRKSIARLPRMDRSGEDAGTSGAEATTPTW